jgi:hypothetical protein
MTVYRLPWLGIVIGQTNDGIGIPAFIISVQYRSEKMPDFTAWLGLVLDQSWHR